MTHLKHPSRGSKMRYYSYNHLAESETKETTNVVTLSEQEILDQFYDFWYERMCKKYGKGHVDENYGPQECIEDWVVVNWAWEST